MHTLILLIDLRMKINSLTIELNVLTLRCHIKNKKTQKCILMILNGWPDITTRNIYTTVFRVKLLKNRTRNMQHHIYVVDYRMTL
jgi:hypothetical protein